MYCTKCGLRFATSSGRQRSNIDRGTMLLAVIVAALVLAAGAVYFVFLKEKTPVVNLMSHGRNVGQIPIGANGFMDINKFEAIEATIIAEDTSGLNLAGWYYDQSFTDPLFKFRQITTPINLYADWNTLDFTMTQSPTSPVSNSEICVFTNTTDNATNTKWTIVDAFKTNNSTFANNSPGEPTYTATLKKGMYQVTMTTTVDGVTKRMTKTETVKGIITNAPVQWHDYDQQSLPTPPPLPPKWTLPAFSFDVEDYIELAKLNRSRDFRIPNIASFVSGTDALIQQIADSLTALMDPSWNMQQRINFIASFVNDGLADGQTPASRYDYTFYKIEGFHKNNVSVEYYKYPIEGLYDRILYGGVGDCEDHAILVAAIAKAAGFGVSIIVITNPAASEGHAVAGIYNDPSFDPLFEPPADNPPLSFKEVDNYYCCETFRKGMRPWVGLVETKYTEPGWTLRAFPVA